MVLLMSVGLLAGLAMAKYEVMFVEVVVEAVKVPVVVLVDTPQDKMIGTCTMLAQLRCKAAGQLHDQYGPTSSESASHAVGHLCVYEPRGKGVPVATEGPFPHANSGQS